MKNKYVQKLHVSHLVRYNEGTSESFVSIKGAAPLGVAHPGNRSVSRRTPHISAGYPDCGVVTRVVRTQGHVQTPIPTVDVLQGFPRITDPYH